MEVKIEIEDWLSESEMKEIATDAFRSQVIERIKINQNKSYESEINRIIGNIAYETFFSAIDAQIPNAEEQIREKVLKIIGDVRSYNVFRFHDDFHDIPSEAAKIVTATVKANEDLIKQRTIEAIGNYALDGVVGDAIESMLEKQLDSIGNVLDAAYRTSEKRRKEE